MQKNDAILRIQLPRKNIENIEGEREFQKENDREQEGCKTEK